MDSINRSKIRGIIAEKRMTYRELAIATGFTETTISNFLNGKNPSYRLMRALRKALSMDSKTADEIFFASDLPNE